MNVISILMLYDKLFLDEVITIFPRLKFYTKTLNYTIKVQHSIPCLIQIVIKSSKQ